MPPQIAPIATSGASTHASETHTAPPAPPAAAPARAPATMASTEAGLDQLAGTPAPSPAATRTAAAKSPAPAPTPAPDSTDLEARLAAGPRKAAPKVEAAASTDETSEAAEAADAPALADAGPTATPPLTGPKALREALAKHQARADKAEARARELEESAGKHTTLAEELETRKKTADEMEGRLRVLDYRQSGEYQERFGKPMDQAWKAAMTDIAELVVATDGQGGTRSATAKDFETLLTMSRADAKRAAKAMFGEDADDVMTHRRTLVDLSRNADAALAEHQTNGANLARQKQAEAIANRERTDQLWGRTLEESTKRYPQLFGPVEGDEEGNRYLEQGVREADEAMGDLSAVPLEQRITTHARMRNRAAAWPREVHRRQVAEAEVADLKARLAAYEASEPGRGQPARGDATTTAAARTPGRSGATTLEGVLAGMDGLG